MSVYEECSDPERLAAHQNSDNPNEWVEKAKGVRGESWIRAASTTTDQYRRAIDFGVRYRLVHPEPDYPIVWVVGDDREFRLLAEHGDWCWLLGPKGSYHSLRSSCVLREPPKPPTKRVQWWEALRDGAFLIRPDGKAGVTGARWGHRPHRVLSLILGNGDEIAVPEDGTVEVLA